MPLVSSADILPKTQPHSITKAEGSAVHNNTTAQQNAVDQGQRPPTNLHQKSTNLPKEWKELDNQQRIVDSQKCSSQKPKINLQN